MLSNDPLELLVGALSRPEQLSSLSLDRWDLLLRQARAADVLARLACRLEDVNAFGRLPVRLQRHLEAAQKLSRRQQTELHFEVIEIHKALSEAAVPTILLKGAAYALAGLSAGAGRMVSDIDILVARDQLPSVEACLMRAGWVTTTHDEYDQRYYRTWMHEIPALEHVHRGSVLDVHHSVVPPTAGYLLDSHKLLDASVPVESLNGVRVLCDVDMVVHSAVHLMHEGELEMGFRGLVDIDALVTEFASRDARFWSRLAARSTELHVQRPVFLALRYTRRLLGTEVPDDCFESLLVQAEEQDKWRLTLLDWLYERGLRPRHASFEDRFSDVARGLLYMRSHVLRMPLHLLLPHLARKSWRRMLDSLKNKEAKDAQA